MTCGSVNSVQNFLVATLSTGTPPRQYLKFYPLVMPDNCAHLTTSRPASLIRGKERSIIMSLSTEAVIAIVVGVLGFFTSIISLIFNYITLRQTCCAGPNLGDVEQQLRTAAPATSPTTPAMIITCVFHVSIHAGVVSTYYETAAVIRPRFNLSC